MINLCASANARPVSRRLKREFSGVPKMEEPPVARVPCSSSRKLIAEPVMLSKEYLDTARTLLRVARNMTDQTIANRLKALAADYERRAEQASHADAGKTSALGRGAARVR
jgi:hypothetical protein